MKIKKLVLPIVVGLLISATAAAENSFRSGAKAINLTVKSTADAILLSDAFDTRLKGKFFTSSNMAIMFGVGLNINGGDANGTDISLMGGARSYKSRGDYATFFGGLISYTDVEAANTTELAILGEFGGEYFLGRQFSVEGSLRAGYVSTDVGPFNYTNLGTFGGQVSLNYYF